MKIPELTDHERATLREESWGQWAKVFAILDAACDVAAGHPGHELAIASAVAWVVARTHAVPGNAGDLPVDADEASQQAATKQITLARRQQCRQSKIDA